MSRYLIEEKKKYAIDCANALWKSSDMHDLYHACGLPEILCDADFVIETEKSILLVEYKNAKLPEAITHTTEENRYSPFKHDNLNKLISKYYDSLHYLQLSGKSKPVSYICVLEYPDDDRNSRKKLRNLLQRRLPFKLQEQFDTGVKLIESVKVVNIAEWNTDDLLGKFPFVPVDQLCT